VDRDPSFLLSSFDKAEQELALFRVAGGGTIVDMTPVGPGRAPEVLARLSRKTGVHIVAATGFAPWALDRGSPLERLDPEALAALASSEITEGMDAANFLGTVRRTTVRAGVIKAAVDESLGGTEQFVRAAFIAHLETGAPISVHTEKGSGAPFLLRMMDEYQVSPEAVALAHVLQHRDDGYLLDLAASGTYLIIDGMGKPQYGLDTRIIRRIELLLSAGFEHRLLLGMDLSKSTYWKSYDGLPGFDYLLRVFGPALRDAGVTPETVELMLKHNPAHALRMREV